MSNTETNEFTAEQSRIGEFSPRKLFTLLEESVRYLLGKWLLILGCGMGLGLVYVVMNYSRKPVYTAEMSFALDEGAVKSAGNSITSLSEELGFGPSYEAGGIFSSMTNILELMQSRLLITKTLLSKAEIDGKSLLYADFFLDSLSLRAKWMGGSPYEKMDFLKAKVSREEELFRNGILNAMYEMLAKQAIRIDKKGKGTTLISVSLTTEHEAFSRYFLEALVAEVSAFYVEIKTHRAKVQLEFIKQRADSVQLAYSQAMYGKASFVDANINVSKQTAVVPGDRKQTDIQVLRETYIGLMRNLEAAKTSLMQETPLFQYLDRPVFPLKADKANLLFRFIILSIIGSILTAVFLLVRRFYRFVMGRDQDEPSEEEYITEVTDVE